MTDKSENTQESEIVILADDRYGDSYVWALSEYNNGAAVQDIRECFDREGEDDDEIQKELDDVVEHFDLSDAGDLAELEENHQYEIYHRPCTAAADAIIDQFLLGDELREIMTSGEIVELYNLNESTVRHAIRRGTIRARKSGKTWLVRREDAQEQWGTKKHG